MILGSSIPLTPEQKVIPSGAVLPSGEMNFFDLSQDRSYHDGSGISVLFPSPNFNPISGLLDTKPPTDGITTTGVINNAGVGNIFNYGGVTSQFSDGYASLQNEITDFTIFNPYIHYYATPIVGIGGAAVVEIPYISDYTVSTPFDVYSIDNYAYYVYSQIFGTGI